MAISHRAQENAIFDVIDMLVLRNLNTSGILHNNFRKEDMQSNNGDIITETTFILTLNDGADFIIRLFFSENDIDIRTTTNGDDPHILTNTFICVANNIDNIKKRLLPLHQQVLKANKI